MISSKQATAIQSLLNNELAERKVTIWPMDSPLAEGYVVLGVDKSESFEFEGHVCDSVVIDEDGTITGQ